MKELIIDDEYKLVLNNPNRNIWDVYKNDILLPSKVDKLYKYYKLNLYNIDSLLRHYFFLANPGEFNDPFDCNINLLKNIPSTDNMETVKRNNYRNVGVCCLSENINSKLMWAHYTDNYNGFVIEFNAIGVNIKKEDYNQYALSRVIYPEKPIQVDIEYPCSHQYLFTTKQKHWEYEQEWRIIAHLNTEIREMQYSPEIVSGIYIGHNIPDKNPGLYSLLMEIQEIRFPKVPIYVVYPQSDNLDLMFEKVWD